MSIVLLAGNRSAQADAYPSGAIKVISDSAPGSAPDVILRIFGEEASHILGQQIVVINTPGANGSRAVHAAASAAPDGYTLLMAVGSTFVTIKGSASNIPVVLPTDFAAVSLIGEQPMFMVVSPAIGVGSLTEFIALARSKPGEISYAVAGRGRQSHLTGAMLERRMGIRLIMVPYSGGPAQAMGDLVTGRVHSLIEGGTALLGAMQTGMIKAIAVGSEARLPEFPELAAFAEVAPGFKSGGWLALLAPLGTPAPMITTLNDAARTALTKPDVKRRLAELGSYARPLSPEETVAYVQHEQATWAPILDELSRSVQ